MLTPAINPKYGLYWHVLIWQNEKDHSKGLLKAQITQSNYNPVKHQNVYFLDVYSEKMLIGQGYVWIATAPLKVVRLEVQIIDRA